MIKLIQLYLLMHGKTNLIPANNNIAFNQMLTDGIDVKFSVGEGKARSDKVWLIDFETPENNAFLGVNQFTIIENHINKRPDIILFVNGLPLVVLKIKNAPNEKRMSKRRSISCKLTRR